MKVSRKNSCLLVCVLFVLMGSVSLAEVVEPNLPAGSSFSYSVTVESVEEGCWELGSERNSTDTYKTESLK